MGGEADGPGPAAVAAAEQGCSRVVCCIGDIHGFYSKLLRLWTNLEARLGVAGFRTALVIFLGDYCDRGPQTREVIDFLISLPARYPEQTHVFLCGNHDLAFAAFVGALPPPPNGSPFSDTWGEYVVNKEREGWYDGEGYDGMHLQGRRWAGKIKDEWNPKKGMKYMGSIYDAGPTFESYGVPHGSSELAKALPDEHKKFLADLVWIHEDNVCIGNGRVCRKLIAVHAGLDKTQSILEQLMFLRSRDTSISKVEQLSGRKNVWEIPKELADGSTVIVSGHHGKLYTDDRRFIIDEGGGKAELPVAALILPSQEIVRDTDDPTS